MNLTIALIFSGKRSINTDGETMMEKQEEFI